MNEQPIVSVAIPTRNRYSLLRETVRSLLAQSRTDWTAIVSDNASTDGTAGFLDALAGDARFVVRRHETAVTRVDNYNSLMNLVKTPFVLVLADDDVLHPDYLARTVGILEEDARVAMAHSCVQLIDLEGRIIAPRSTRVAQKEPLVSGWTFIRRTLRQGLQAHQSAALFRTGACPRPAFDSRDGYADDIGLQLRLALHGLVAYVDEPLADIRLHEVKDSGDLPPTADPRQRVRLLADQHALRTRFLQESDAAVGGSATLRADARAWYRSRLVSYAIEPGFSDLRGVLSRSLEVTRREPRAWADPTVLRAAVRPRPLRGRGASAQLPPPRIGVLGRYGSVNLGNNASLACLVQEVRARLPEADIEAICHRPEGVDPGLHVSTRALRPPRPTSRTFLGVNRASWHVVGAMLEVRSVLRASRDIDALLVGGTGVVDDFGGTRPAALLLPIAEWSAGVRLRRGRVEWINVGAGPMSSLRGRVVAAVSARLATRRSYRDIASQAFMHSLHVGSATDEVHCDIVFSLTTPRELTTERLSPSVVIAVMDYRGWTPGPASEEIRNRYLSALADLVLWAYDRGCAVELVQADGTDRAALETLTCLLEETGVPSGYWTTRTFDTMEKFVRGLGGKDVVVVTRYHALVAAMLAGVAPVSLSYTGKSDDLLSRAGLGGDSQPIESVNADLLARQVTRAIRDRDMKVAMCQAQVERFAHDLQDQMDHLARRIAIGQ